MPDPSLIMNTALYAHLWQALQTACVEAFGGGAVLAMLYRLRT